MSYYTFLLIVEVTIEGPDAGEASDRLSWALTRQARWLRDEGGAVIGYLHDTDPYPRWWPARPVEVVEIEREEDVAGRSRRGRKVTRS